MQRPPQALPQPSQAGQSCGSVNEVISLHFLCSGDRIASFPRHPAPASTALPVRKIFPILKIKTLTQSSSKEASRTHRKQKRKTRQMS